MSVEDMNNDIDWLKCQKTSSETLQCAAQLTRSEVELGAGYEGTSLNSQVC